MVGVNQRQARADFESQWRFSWNRYAAGCARDCVSVQAVEFVYWDDVLLRDLGADSVPKPAYINKTVVAKGRQPRNR